MRTNKFLNQRYTALSTLIKQNAYWYKTIQEVPELHGDYLLHDQGMDIEAHNAKHKPQYTVRQHSKLDNPLVFGVVLGTMFLTAYIPAVLLVRMWLGDFSMEAGPVAIVMVVVAAWVATSVARCMFGKRRAS